MLQENFKNFITSFGPAYEEIFDLHKKYSENRDEYRKENGYLAYGLITDFINNIGDTEIEETFNTYRELNSFHKDYLIKQYQILNKVFKNILFFIDFIDRPNLQTKLYKLLFTKSKNTIEKCISLTEMDLDFIDILTLMDRVALSETIYTTGPDWRQMRWYNAKEHSFDINFSGVLSFLPESERFQSDLQANFSYLFETLPQKFGYSLERIIYYFYFIAYKLSCKSFLKKLDKIYKKYNQEFVFEISSNHSDNSEIDLESSSETSSNRSENPEINLSSESQDKKEYCEYLIFKIKDKINLYKSGSLSEIKSNKNLNKLIEIDKFFDELF